MVSFVCNICGQTNTIESLDHEASSCGGCGSNVRLRALIYLLSKELFGDGLALPAYRPSAASRDWVSAIN